MIRTMRSDSGKVSIIIPVVNEIDNVRQLIDGIASLPKTDSVNCIKEIVFVDDGSTDGTQQAIKSSDISAQGISIVLRERKEKHATVNAQLYGMSQAKHDVVIVMDGDLHHPVRYLPNLIEKYKEGFDLVIASRYIKGGSTERTLFHSMVSHGANFAAKIMLPPARKVRDSVSGFFIVNRKIVNSTIEPNGHNKLSLYILSGTRRLSVAEIPYSFVERNSGESKVAACGKGYIRNYL